MAQAFLNLQFHPAQELSQNMFPALRRMTGAPATGCSSREYFLTASAAKTIERNPQILLHQRLYDKDERTVYLYQEQGRDLCAITLETRVKPGSIGSPFTEKVMIAAPEELNGKAEMKKVGLKENYPSLFLPYDLDRARADVEAELRGTASGYRSPDFPNAIYFGSDPFVTYHAFHYLTSHPNPLTGRIAELKHVIDLGSGLGLISFVLSQFLTNDARASGIEFNPALVGWAYRVRKYLQNKLHHDVGRTRFYEGDIRTGHVNARIEDADALIGWFPMNHELSERDLASLFSRMRTGGMVFQLFSQGPLADEETARAFGFREIEIDPEAALPVSIYEKHQDIS